MKLTRKYSAVRQAAFLTPPILASIILFCLTLPAAAQPPERVRLDLGMALWVGGKNGFMGGVFAPRTSPEQVDAVTYFDVSTVINATERLHLGGGLPFGVIVKPARGLLEADGWEVGIGDVHAELGYLLFPERKRLPGLQVQAEMGAPTADHPALGVGLYRATGRLTLSKAVSEKVNTFIDGSYSHYFEAAGLRQDPVITIDGGLGFGISKSWYGSLQVGYAFGGKRIREGVTRVDDLSDLRAGIGLTKYSKGRPRTSLFLGAGQLLDEPAFIATMKWAIFSW